LQRLNGAIRGWVDTKAWQSTDENERTETMAKIDSIAAGRDASPEPEAATRVPALVPRCAVAGIALGIGQPGWVRWAGWLVAGWAMLLMQSPAIHAQQAPSLEAMGLERPVAIEARAVVENNLGIGMVLIPAGQIIASELDQRIFYPAVEIVSLEPGPAPAALPPRRPNEPQRIGGGALIKRLKGAIERVREHVDPTEHVRVHFLFVGTDTLHLRLTGEIDTTLELEPQRIVASSTGNRVERPESTSAVAGSLASSFDPRWRSMLDAWWQGYTQQTQRQIERSDYPSLIERYLVHMLGSRFGYPVPELLKPQPKLRPRQTDPLPTLSLVAGAESLRDEVRQEQLTLSTADRAARVAIPKPPIWQDLPLPEPADGSTFDSVPMENIAQAVPPECFYIRFGSFANYLWFQELSASRGGDLAQMALLRGFNYETNLRAERMLSTKMNYVSKLFGDAVIGDMAIVGYDLYLQEGPTMGVVFEARNFGLLKSSFQQERDATVKRLASDGCKLETVEIDDQSVSFLSTPDNQVRSFMVESEPFLFVTTSRELARRFLEVRRTGQSLAALPAYRFTRMMMPESNKYDAFGYFSSEFFRNLISPRYQIELRRRLRATAAIETAETATLVAQAERERGFAIPFRPASAASGFSNGTAFGLAGGAGSDPIDGLIEEGYLPVWFQRRVDGSETLQFQGSWHDSVRGRRGSFMPIADVPLVDCTPEESAEYRAAADFYATQWQQTDPLMFGLRRYSHPELPNVERIAIEAYIAPLGSQKYGWLGLLLAPPMDSQVQLPTDDIVSLQVHLRGFRDARSQTPNHFLFAGIKDVLPPLPEETKGLLATLRILKSLPVYLGAWPKPAYLDRLPLGLGGGPPDLVGFSKTLIGMWRWQMGGFSVISFDREILETCAMALRILPADDVAQGRMLVRDLSKSQMAGWFNTFGFRQAAQTTRGNLLLLDSMVEQLGVPVERAREQAESLLDAKLQCTLEGEYQIDQGRWTTTAWPAQIQLAPGAHASTMGFDPLHSVAPEGYLAPWLEWFRGTQLHLTQTPERLIVVGHFDMEPLPPSKSKSEGPPEASALPKLNFDIYNLPFQMFNRDKPKKGKDSEGDKNPAEPGTKRRF
jgi:hypothetical protein